MKICLVRHGETEENFLNKLYTTTNCPLNDTGRRQMERLKFILSKKKYHYCFSSSQVRCFESALILVGDKVEIIPDNRIAERCVGELEGRPYVEYNQYKFWDWERNCSDYGVESVKDLYSRCLEFFNELVDKYYNKTIMIVVDKEVYRMLRHIILKTKFEYNLLDGEIENAKYEEFKYTKKNLNK